MASSKSLTALKRFSSCDVRPIHPLPYLPGKYRQAPFTIYSFNNEDGNTDR